MKDNRLEYVVLFPFCKVVQGKTENIICNFQKKVIRFITADMAKMLSLFKEYPLGEVADIFSDEKEIFDEYLNFLLEEGFAFISSDPTNFIDVPNVWFSPEIINNAVIEYDFDHFCLSTLLNSLDDLFTKHLEIRLCKYGREYENELGHVLDLLTSTCCRSLRLFVPHLKCQALNRLIKILPDYNLVEHLYIYGHPTAGAINNLTTGIEDSLHDITYSSVSWSRKQLVNDIQYFHEAQQYNPYYNKKVCVNRVGEIKNCLKNKATFGNVNSDDLLEVVSRPDFQMLWHASHQKIVDVKDDPLRFNYYITADLDVLDNGMFKINNKVSTVE